MENTGTTSIVDRLINVFLERRKSWTERIKRYTSDSGTTSNSGDIINTLKSSKFGTTFNYIETGQKVADLAIKMPNPTNKDLISFVKIEGGKISNLINFDENKFKLTKVGGDWKMLPNSDGSLNKFKQFVLKNYANDEEILGEFDLTKPITTQAQF